MVKAVQSSVGPMRVSRDIDHSEYAEEGDEGQYEEVGAGSKAPHTDPFEEGSFGAFLFYDLWLLFADCCSVVWCILCPGAVA